MKSKLDKKKPLCPQLCEQICINIANGIYKDGGRLPSVRELAVMAGVNPNTVQRAYETLELQGTIYSVRGSGWYVAEDNTQNEKIMHNLMKEKTEEYFEAMMSLGMSKEQIKEYFPNLKSIFYAAGTVQFFARPFLNRGVRIFSAWAANAVPVAV